MAKTKPRKNIPELALIGDVDDWEADTIKSLLELPEGSECILYFDSAGGNPYGALAVVTLLRVRRLRATAIVLGECSSSALLVFAACQRRFTGPLCTFLFHRIRWQSDKRVLSEEARQWVKHFEQMETDLDEFQHQLFGATQSLTHDWNLQGRYVTGREMVAAGLAEMLTV
jgi:ATP-dependent protease ClpP protease subunit